MLPGCLELFGRQKYLCTGINRLAQRFARLEVWNAFLRDGDAFARTRVSAHAWRAAIDRETSETTNLYPVPAHECVAHGIKDCLDGVFCIAVRQLAEPCCQFFDKITSSHAFLMLFMRERQKNRATGAYARGRPVPEL